MGTYKLEITGKEATILRDAMIDHLVNLRTIYRPDGTEQVLTESLFLSKDISDGRRENYMITKALVEHLKEITFN